jgi:hypothetical protein
MQRRKADQVEQDLYYNCDLYNTVHALLYEVIGPPLEILVLEDRVSDLYALSASATNRKLLQSVRFVNFGDDIRHGRTC